MKVIIEKLFSARTLALMVAVCATSGVWAETESALIVDVADTSVTIANYSSSSRLDQSGITPSNPKICIASGLNSALVASGMRVRVDNFEFVRDYNGTTPAPSKIRIVVDGVAHTSDTRTETSLSLKHQEDASKPISYGCKYVFPSTPYLKVGESYDVNFLDSTGNTQSSIRYEVVNNSAELITGISASGWRPAYKMSGTIIATVSKANNDTITSADAGGLIVVNGGTVNVSGSATATGLIVSSNTTLHFEEGATLTLSGPLYVESGNTLAISSADTISGSQTFITAGSVCATAGAIVSSDASYSASATSATVALTSYSNEASVSGVVDWSSIVWADGTWHDGSPATLTLTDDATINFDNTYSMSSLTLTGAHTVTLVYTKTPTISSGISCENSATCKIKIPATSTDWPIASEWAVPNDGITYILVGSSDSNSPTTCAGKITVNGKLETTGYLNLSAENKIAATGELKVLDGRTKMNTGENGGGICGTLTIESGAVFENARSGDGLNYGGSPTVDVYGTLDMASTRWTINSANTLNFYAGSTVTGTGQSSYGALDSNQAVIYNILAEAGQGSVNFSAKLRLRQQQTFNIDAGVTVNCTGTVGDSKNQINITGSGTFKIATGASFLANVPFNVTSPATLELAGGTVADAIKGTGNLSVTSGTYEPSFSSFSGAVSVSGSGVLTLTPAQVTAVSGITVGSGSTLKIKVTADEILHGYDASGKVSNGGGTVMFVDSSGTEITENVSGDGETLSAAAKIWGDSASGTWDTAANWTVGVAPSDGDTVLLETADATITISTSSAAGAVSVNESTTIAGTAAALQSFATKVTSITIASGKTLTLSCTDDGAYEFNRSIGGAGALAVSHGTVTFKQENTFTGGLTVKQGGTLVKGDGVKRFGPDGRSITVEVGGTLDLNKTSVSGTGVSYAITIVEGDSSVWETTPVLTNTGDSLGTGWKQTSSITVRANATIECNSNHNWGLLASGYGTSSLKIGKGKTLRKVGGGEFWLTNVTLSNLDGDSGSGDAVLKVVEGSANVINQGPSYSNSLSSGALFKVEVVGGSLEVNKNFTISALSHQGGSVNIAADKTLTVPSINVAANATMSPSGTIACNGDMTIGGTVTVPADKTWRFGSSDNDTSVNAGRISVVSGGTLVINGRVENRNRYGSSFNGLSIESGGTVQVGATGTLADLDYPGYTWYNINCQTMVAGNLVIDGTWHNYGIVTVAATGKLSVADTRNVQNVNSEILNYGQVEMIRWGYLTYGGFYIRNYDSGAVVYAPDDDNVGQSVEPITKYVSFAQGTSATVLFDVSNLTSLPSGTSALTLLTTSTSLALTADSLTGCTADYYVKQDGTTGAVTLQLHAAKDNDGGYYKDIGAIYTALSAKKVVVVLDGQGETYKTTLEGIFPSIVYNDTDKTLMVAVAQVGATKYPSLGAAISDAEDDSTVTLLANSNEAVSLTGKTIVFDENGKGFTGTLSGNGTIKVSTAPSTTTWSSARFADGWTGTFVINWEDTAASSSTAIKCNRYGIAGSTVRFCQDFKGWFSNEDGTDIADIIPALELDAKLEICNGSSKVTAWDKLTTLSKLSSSENGQLIFSGVPGDTSNSPKFHYEITTIESFAGTISIGAHTRVRIGKYNFPTEVSAAGFRLGNNLVAISIASGGSLYNCAATPAEASTAGIDVALMGNIVPGNKVVYDTDGLYPAVASITVNAQTTYYSTYANAATASLAGGIRRYSVLLMGDTTPSGWYVSSDNLNDYIKPIASAQVTVEPFGGNPYVTTKYYETLAGAISAVDTDGTVALLDDTAEENVSLVKAIVLSEGDFTFTGSFTGNGTVVLGAALKSASSDRWPVGWTGTVELKDITTAITGFSFNNYGNAASTVRMNNVKCRFADGSIGDVGCIDVINDGLILDTTDWQNDKTKTIAANITGSGAIVLSSQCNTAVGHTYYVFTGDVSEFTGALNFGSINASYRSTIVFKCEGDNIPTASVAGQIFVQENAEVNVGAAWTATQLIVDGSLSVANTGTLTGTIAGGGTITYAALPSAPTFGSWTGTVVLPANQAFGGQMLDDYGIAGSKVRLQGANTGWFYYKNSNGQMVATTIEIPSEASLTVTGLSPSFANGFDKLIGEGTFGINITGNIDLSDGGYSAYFQLKDVSGFTGSLSATGAGIAISDIRIANSETGGKIIVAKDATVHAGATWTAANNIKMTGTATLTYDPGDGNTYTMNSHIASATTSNKVIVKSGVLKPNSGAGANGAFSQAEIEIQDGAELLLDYSTDVTGYNDCGAPIRIKSGGILNVGKRETMAHDLYFEGGTLKITGTQGGRGLDLFSSRCDIVVTENSQILATGDYPVYLRDGDVTMNIAEGKTLACNCAIIYHSAADNTDANSKSNLIKQGSGALVLNGYNGGAFALPKGLNITAGVVEVNTVLNSNGQTGDAANVYTVASGAKLKVGSAGQVNTATLTLSDGSLLEFGAGNATLISTTTTSHTSGNRVQVSFSDGVTPEDDTTLISWSAAPAGDFELIDSDDVPVADWRLVKDAEGLKLSAIEKINNASSDEAGYIDAAGVAVITNTTAQIDVSGLSVTGFNVYPTSNDSTLKMTMSQAMSMESSLRFFVKYNDNGIERIQDITTAFAAGSPSASGGNFEIPLLFTARDVNTPTKVTVNEETIYVDPKTDTSATPMAMDEDETSFAIKTIPGLWYSAWSSTTIDASGNLTGSVDKPTDPIQATTTSTEINNGSTEDSVVRYYKIAVGVSKDDVK